jgi:UDP-GlcNAc:undecaprenyl-phosphate GlcNAc-1-phosphate transferase
VVLHTLGLVDDRRPLRPTLKLLTIVLVGLLVATLGHVRVAEFAGRPVSVLLTVAWFVVIVNSFNFLDNMDGLAAGVAGICLAFLTVCGLMAGQVLVPALGCVFLGAVAGFLIFNFPPARIFMGDAGSLVLGYMLATVSVLTTYFKSGQGTPPYALTMPLVILAVPLYDFVSVVLIRLVEGRNPMHGDQRHFSHRLVQRGLSRRFAVLTIYLATATTGLAATLLPGADLRRTITIGVIVLMVLAIIAILEAPLRKET